MSLDAGESHYIMTSNGIINQYSNIPPYRLKIVESAGAPSTMQLRLLKEESDHTWFSLGAYFMPENTHEEIVKIEISDESIVSLDNAIWGVTTCYKAGFNVHGEGEVTIIATSKNGLTATYTYVAGEKDDVVENRLILDSEALSGYNSVWIDGAEMAIQKDGVFWYIDLPDSNASVMTTYTYHVDATAEDGVDAHRRYPLCLYYFKKAGFYLYASTRPILEETLEEMGYSGASHEEIKIKDGEILVIDAKGSITRDHFTAPVSPYSYSFYDCWEPITTEPTGYRKYMMEFAAAMGVPKKELEWLHHAGYPTYDIEEAVFSSDYRTMLLLESGYYDEGEEEYYEFNDDYFKNYAWV